MVEADDGAPANTTAKTAFPVVLYDGEREMDVGNIEIHPDLVFKEFQTMLSKLIGISYNNLTTYLVDSKKSKLSPDRRKILITGKANFAVIVKERNCYFLVVLKRSRRDRRRKLVKSTNFDFDFDFRLSPSLSSSLLPVDLSRIGWNSHDLNDARLSVPNPYFYDDRFHDLLMQRENYMNVIMNSGYGFESFDSPLNMNFPAIGDAYPRVQSNNNNNNRSLCEECTVAQKQGITAEFHLCVYDEVVTGGFRSPAGPISRPP